MTKLQKIKRANGSVVHSVNIPLEIIEELDWKKGENLSLETLNNDGNQVVIISKSEEDSG